MRTVISSAFLREVTRTQAAAMPRPAKNTRKKQTRLTVSAAIIENNASSALSI